MTGNNSPNVFKLATETGRKEVSLIEGCTSSSIVHQPFGFTCTRRSFRISDLTTSLLRQFRISFLAQPSTLLFMPIVFFAFFTVVSHVMAFKGTKRSKCSLTHFKASANLTCTLEDPLQLNDPQQRNIFYNSLVIMFTGLLIITNTTIVHSKSLKIFQNEHRNCKY